MRLSLKGDYVSRGYGISNFFPISGQRKKSWRNPIANSLWNSTRLSKTENICICWWIPVWVVNCGRFWGIGAISMMEQPDFTQVHTGRFDSNFSHIFISNTKFELLYEHRPNPKLTYMSNIQQNSVELWTNLRFCNHAPIS